MKNLLKRFVQARTGNVAVEYITIASVISVAFFTGAVDLGNLISQDFIVLSEIIGGPPVLDRPR